MMEKFLCWLTYHVYKDGHCIRCGKCNRYTHCPHAKHKCDMKRMLKEYEKWTLHH